MARRLTTAVTGPAAPETLRQGQLERRERIVHAALKALAAEDYDRLMVTDVARSAGVALGTLYRYFSSKEHLIAAAFLEWHSALDKKVRARSFEGMTERERLDELFKRTIKAFELQPQFFRVMMMMESTSDPYASEAFARLTPMWDSILEAAFDGPLDEQRRFRSYILNTVLFAGLRSWLTGRGSIDDVYRNVEGTLEVIYGGAN